MRTLKLTKISAEDRGALPVKKGQETRGETKNLSQDNKRQSFIIDSQCFH